MITKEIFSFDFSKKSKQAEKDAVQRGRYLLKKIADYQE